jgi:hypothetical protein
MKSRWFRMGKKLGGAKGYAFCIMNPGVRGYLEDKERGDKKTESIIREMSYKDVRRTNWLMVVRGRKFY